VAQLIKSRAIEADGGVQWDETPIPEDENRSDPILWFGVLVPSALRESQKNFVSAVDSIPKLVHTIARLRQLEHEIGRLRKTLKRLDKKD
jgi:hypothetical protein